MSGFLQSGSGGGGGGGFTAGGDLSGTSTSQNVINIHGASVPIAGALTTGNILQVTGLSTLGYAPLNVGGGSNFIIGILPVGNQAPQSANTLTGTILASNIVSSSLTSVGTLTNLTVTNPISASITGNAATVTTNANLTGDVTSSGNATTVVKMSGAAPVNVVNSALSFGTTPSATGILRLPNTNDQTPISFRNAGNTADLPILGVDSANSLNIGSNNTINYKGVNHIFLSSGTTTWSMVGSTGQFQFSNTASTAPGLIHNAIATASATGAIFTIQAQNATGTTSTGGNLVLASGSGTTASGSIQNKVGAITVLQQGIASTDFISLDATPATTGHVRLPTLGSINWRNNANTADIQVLAKTSSDALIVGGQSGSLVGTMQLSASSQFNFLIGSTQVFNASTAGGVKVSTPGLVFDAAVTGPFVIQNDNTTASATGQNLTIHSQNATGTTANGGSLILGSGTGTSNPGSLQFKVGATVVGQLTATTSDFLTLGSQAATVGGIRLGNNIGINARNSTNTTDFALLNFSASNNVIVGNNTSSIVQLGSGGTVQFGILGTSAFSITATETLISTPPLFSFGPALTNPKIRQQDNTTASAVGQSFIIQAQNATGTTSIGGDGYFTSGTGTTSAGALHLQVGGADVIRLAGNTTDFLKLGSIPATVGTIRLSNTGTITGRNAANSADTTLLFYSGSNNLQIGDTTNVNVGSFNAATQINLTVGSNTLQTLASSTANDFISFGATPSTTGTIRLGNNVAGIKARNAANTADVPLFVFDSSNNLSIGSTTINALTVISSSTQTQIAGSTGQITINSTAVVLSSTNLQFANGQTSATIQPQSNAAASTTGILLSIIGMNKTGATTIGGSVVVQAGAGTSSNGTVALRNSGATAIAQIDDNKLYALKGMSRSITDITSSYSVLATDYIIAVGTLSAAITITLPASPNNGDTYVVKDKIGQGGTNAITVSGNGHNIDGASTAVINTNNFTSISLTYNTASTRWMIT